MRGSLAYFMALAFGASVPEAPRQPACYPVPSIRNGQRKVQRAAAAKRRQKRGRKAGR